MNQGIEVYIRDYRNSKYNINFLMGELIFVRNNLIVLIEVGVKINLDF